jgi:Zn-dependent protease with chaperone function
MLIGNVAISLNLLSVAVVAFAIVVLVLFILAPILQAKLSCFTFCYRKFLLWMLAASPWWVAIVCVGLFWSAQYNFEQTSWFKEFAHWHHIDVFSLGSWHGFALFMAAGFISLLAVTKTYRILKHTNTMHQLGTLAGEQREYSQDGHVIYVLSSDIPTVFTSGLLAPSIYITTALQKQVNQRELDIIIKHEAAHARAHDPFFKVFFMILCSFFPNKISQLLMQQFILLTEQMADSEVTRHHDHLDVAQTLVKVARLQHQLPSHCNGRQLSYFGNEQISQRVHELLCPLAQTPLRAWCFALLLLVMTPLFTASFVDSFHHLIESFFNH